MLMKLIKHKQQEHKLKTSFLCAKHTLIICICTYSNSTRYFLFKCSNYRILKKTVVAAEVISDDCGTLHKIKMNLRIFISGWHFSRIVFFSSDIFWKNVRRVLYNILLSTNGFRSCKKYGLPKLLWYVLIKCWGCLNFMSFLMLMMPYVLY